MQFVVMSIVVVTGIASLGVALWIWLSFDSIGDDLLELAGFDGERSAQPPSHQGSLP